MTDTKWVILFPLTSLFAGLMVVCLRVMGGNLLIDVFKGGIIYNDAALGLIWVENQVSLGENQTVMGKACLSRGFGILCVMNLNNTMAFMEFALLRNIPRSALIKGSLSPFLVSEHNIKMLKPSVLFRQ